MKCPYCGENPVIRELNGVLVCPHCGSVVDEKPIDDSFIEDLREELFSNSFTYRLHSKGIGETLPVSLKDFAIKLHGKERLEVCLRKLYKYYGVLFRDECTLSEAARLIHIVLDSDRARTPRAKILDTLVRTAVLIASRKCGREVGVEVLFPRLKRGRFLKILSRILERFPALREHYVAPRTRESLRDNIVKATMCLENNKLVESTLVGDIVKHSVELLDKLIVVRNTSSTIGALIYLSTKALRLKITQKNVIKCTNTSLKALQGALIEIRRALRISTRRVEK